MRLSPLAMSDQRPGARVLFTGPRPVPPHGSKGPAASTQHRLPAPPRRLGLFTLMGKVRRLARVEGAMRHWLRGCDPAMSAVSRVRPNLLITGLAGAYNREALQAAGVDWVVSCLGENFNFWPQHFTYESVSLNDDAGQALSPAVYADALHARLQVGHQVLVHCRHGRSRSATVILSYLMKYEGLSLDAALADLRAHRGIVQPNAGFVAQLSAWEAGGLPG